MNSNAPTLEQYRARINVPVCKWCRTLLPQKVDFYEHEYGWVVQNVPHKLWLSIKCSKCEYEWSLNKLGVPRGEYPLNPGVSAPAPVVPTVLKVREADRSIQARIPLTDELCEHIARFNGYLTVDEVRRGLLNGLSIYTNFNYYVLE